MYCVLLTIPKASSSFSEFDSIMFVIPPSRRFIAEYLCGLSPESMQMMGSFHLPPKMSVRYLNGHIVSIVASLS